jgi:Transcriptional regulator containing an amidase domain and an AraC-type DNA-binding HTH domain
MEKFQIIEPSTLLAPYVKQYWFLAIDDAQQSSQRSIPAGCACLAFHRGERIYSSLHNGIQPIAYLSVPSMMYTDVHYRNIDVLMIIFQPIGCKTFFGIPMNELRGQNIAIELLNDPQVTELENRLIDAVDNYQCVQWIEQFLLKRIYQFDSYNFNRLDAVIKAVNSGETEIPLLAETACLGYKQFKRVFMDYTGLKPKEFLLMARFRRTLHALQTQSWTSLNALAYDCGYYDKSHLIKEFKTFAGYNPREYLSICDPYSDYLSLFNSFFINGRE